jgi:hypothetical protein
MEDVFFRDILLAGNKHLEVETYSFDLVPGDKPPLVLSIAQELRWLQQRLYAQQPHAGSHATGDR